jgi:hypothetical protein
MVNLLQLKPLVNLIHLLHLATINSSEDPTPLVSDWGLDGTVERGWDLMIPASGVVPFLVPILEMLGFKLLDGEFFILSAKPGESAWGSDKQGPYEMDLIADVLLKHGTVDANMIACLTGREGEFLACQTKQSDLAVNEAPFYRA